MILLCKGFSLSTATVSTMSKQVKIRYSRAWPQTKEDLASRGVMTWSYQLWTRRMWRNYKSQESRRIKANSVGNLNETSAQPVNCPQVNTGVDDDSENVMGEETVHTSVHVNTYSLARAWAHCSSLATEYSSQQQRQGCPLMFWCWELACPWRLKGSPLTSGLSEAYNPTLVLQRACLKCFMKSRSNLWSIKLEPITL